MKKIILILTAVIATFSFTSCTKESINAYDGKINLTIDSKVDAVDFKLNQDFTISGKTYNFDKLRYWVSNVVLIKSDGTELTVPNSYFLVEETNAVGIDEGYTYPAKKREDIALSSIPAGDYKGIKLSIGVEQKYNDNLSLQIGELSQMNGMTNIAWMWRTSYIFLALHGEVTSGATTKTFVAETGLNANYKTKTIDFAKTLRVDGDKTANVKVDLNVVSLLSGLDVFSNNVIGGDTPTQMSTLATNSVTAISLMSASN